MARLHVAILSIGSLCLLAGDAHAQADHDEGVSCGAEALTSANNAQLLCSSERPACGQNNQLLQRVAGGAPQIIYLNFDGQTITRAQGFDDAPNNASQFDIIVGEWIPLSAFATVSSQQSAIDSLSELFAPFNVSIRRTRPASGDYTMLIVGTHVPPLPGIGYGAYDCNNSNPNNIPVSAHHSIPLMAHELGHTMGLVHIEPIGGIRHIMNPSVNNAATFHPECFALNQLTDTQCQSERNVHCEDGNQNSFAQICTALGTNGDADGCDPNGPPPTDAGVELVEDAGISTPDAASESDASSDAMTVSGSDSGVGEESGSTSGCGCSVSNRSGAATGLWTFMALFILGAGRRRNAA